MESTGQILKYLSLLSLTHTYSTLNIFIVNSCNYEIKNYKTSDQNISVEIMNTRIWY